jgi:Mce-associated membrane protein
MSLVGDADDASTSHTGHTGKDSATVRPGNAIDDACEAASAIDEADGEAPTGSRRRIRWSPLVVFGLLPALALLSAAVAGFFKWELYNARAEQVARIESVAAAKDSTVALLSYQADTAEKSLPAARDRLTGTFKDAYTQLINEVVVPGAKQKHISVTATVPAVASVSASSDHAVVVVCVDQTTTVGTDASTDSTSSVRVTLDRIGNRWLVSGFDPI